MHSTVIFIEGFSNSRLEQWFQASQVLSRIICMAKGFCSWHLTNSYDEQLRSYARRERCDFSVQASGNVFQSWTTFFVWNCARKQFQPVKPSSQTKKDRHWHNMHNMGHCVDSSTMQHHSANRKRASIKIKGSSLQCLHAPRHDNTGSRVPGIRLGLQNSRVLMSCCFFRETERFHICKVHQTSLELRKKTLKHVKKDADLPCQEIMRKMKRRRVRRLTWWICQVRSFCWTALAAIQLPTSNKKILHMYICMAYVQWFWPWTFSA